MNVKESDHGDYLSTRNKSVAWAVIGTSFLGTMGLMFPFVWMQLRSPLPYMSTPRRKVLAALEEITSLRRIHSKPSITFKYFDLGSGDGETVLAAATLPGWDATGIELNYTLWSISNIRRFMIGISQLIFPPQSSSNLFTNCRFRWADFWNISIKDADAVMIFGVTPLMPRIAEKIRTECKPGTFILAYRFRLPIAPAHQRAGKPSPTEKQQYHADTVPHGLNASLVYDKDEMRIYQVLEE